MGQDVRQDSWYLTGPGLYALCVLGMATLLVLLSGVLSYFPLELQAIIAWGAVALILVLKKVLARHPLFLQLLITGITLFLAGRYIIFRMTSTLVFANSIAFIFVISLLLTELYAMAIQLFGMFVNVVPLNRPEESVDLNDPDLPTVDVLIPTYNEPEQMVAITASACTLFEYPQEKVNIYILDDGGTVQKRQNPDPELAAEASMRYETLKVLADFLEVHYRTRDKNISAKAGNINEALYGGSSGKANPSGELVLILDCDHVPTRDFLRNTVGQFKKDPKLFLLQTPHFFINPDPIERNLDTVDETPGNNEMFYCKVLPGLDFWNTAFFCGSAAVLRRKYLDESCGIMGETITEDAETALFLHGKGYNSAFVGKPMVCGLSPETFEDFIVQRNRWAQGMMQILLLKNPLLNKGLSWCQKICYLNICSFWFFGFARFMFMIAPFLYIFFNMRVYHATLQQCLAFAIPYLVASLLLSNLMYGKVRHPFFSELYEMVMSFNNIPSVLSVFRSPRSPTFTVTPKGRSLDVDRASSLSYPFYVLLMFSILMYPVAIYKLMANPALWNSMVISVVWGTYNFILLLLCLGVVWEKKQIRHTHRISVREPVEVLVRGGGKPTPARGWTTNISEEGMGIILDEKIDFPNGCDVDIKTVDAGGKEFTLWAKVLYSNNKDGHSILGCQFQYADELSFFETTNYIYGDSNRWAIFWKKRQVDVSMGHGLVYILKLGFEGTWRHLKGLAVQALGKLKTYLGDRYATK